MYSAAVRANALDDGVGARIADREAHPGPADDVQPAAGCAVQAGVAGEACPGRQRPSCRRPGRGAGRVGSTITVPPDSPLAT